MNANSFISRKARVGVFLLMALASLPVLAGTCAPGIPPSNPDAAYVVDPAGVVTDQRTGLVWDVCAFGQTWTGTTCSGLAAALNFQDALGASVYANNVAWRGKTDWRVPNIKELRSLVEGCAVSGATVNDAVFPNAPAGYTWSSSTWSSSVTTDLFPLAVDFATSGGQGGASVTSGGSDVRLVRGGKADAAYDRLAPTAAPSVTTNAATGIAETAAGLYGDVTSNGAASIVTFQYGETAAYGMTVGAYPSPLSAGAMSSEVSAAVIGLVCNTQYHFRVVAQNSAGTSYGADTTFVTGKCTGTGFAIGATAIDSMSNGSPTIVTTFPVTCPASGAVLVTGSGESTALSTNVNPAFIGLAYSIARDGFATDNTNVVQSSALANFAGDANRDFLNVQRTDGCTPGESYAYRLTVYRTTPDTGPNSFVWNGRLAASDPASAPGAGLAVGSTSISSHNSATPTIVAELPIICPPSGTLLVSGSGESTALSGFGGTAFMGLAYSIARNSFASDLTNIVQSSALGRFNGDANRDFLNVQRLDSCTPGVTSTYRLTAYATTTETSGGSFVWNGRLAARVPLSTPGVGFVSGAALITSSDNAIPTVVTGMSVTCPASGKVLVVGFGESTAISGSSSLAFVGLAYSIARNSLATDNTNVVQSSALTQFNGDANRDFLNLQRVDSCTPGTSYTYNLTAYRTTPETRVDSFLFNGGIGAITLP